MAERASRPSSASAGFPRSHSVPSRPTTTSGGLPHEQAVIRGSARTIGHRGHRSRPIPDGRHWTPTGNPVQPFGPRRLRAEGKPKRETEWRDCGSFAVLAHGPHSSSSSTPSADRIDRLHALLQDRYNRHDRGSLKYHAVHRMTHEALVEDQRGRRVGPEDLCRFLGDLGAKASKAEAKQLLARGGGEPSTDGSVGMRTFHALAHGRSKQQGGETPGEWGSVLRPLTAGSASGERHSRALFAESAAPAAQPATTIQRPRSANSTCGSRRSLRT